MTQENYRMPFRSIFRTSPKIIFAALFSLIAGCSTGQKAPDAESTMLPVLAGTKVDPSGRWCFTDSRGQDLTNSIELVQGGIIVSPVDRIGREVFYTDAGPNRYRHGDDAFYEFLGKDQGQWQRRGENRPLRRCG